MITISFNRTEDLNQQIYMAIVREIASETLQAGDRLPSRRSLAMHLGVSLNTVKKAYGQLLDEGFIRSKERSGFYVDQLNPTLLYRVEAAETNKGDDLSEEDFPGEKWAFNFSYAATDPGQAQKKVWSRLAKRSMEEALLGRSSHAQTHWALKKAVAAYLSSHRGVDTPAKNILLTTGYAENLLLLFMLFKDPIFAVEEPGYLRTDPIFQAAGKNFLPIAIDSSGFSVTDLEKSPANIALTTPNHQFPTGIIMGLRRRQELLSWAEEKPGRYVLEDDYDSDFKYYGKTIPALKSLDQKERVIMSGSFTQSIGSFLAVSYLVLPDPLLSDFQGLKIPKGKVSPIQESLLEKYLSTGAFDRHINHMNTFYRNKREAFIRALREKDPDVVIQGSEAGLHFILGFQRPLPPPEIIKKRAGRERIYIKSLDDYRRVPLFDDLYLVGFGGIPDQKIAEAAQALLALFERENAG